MFSKREEPFELGISKIYINPSYEWIEDAKSLNVSHRELEVFALLMDGHDNKEIAHILGINYQSVKNHIFSLYKKLKAKNMAQALKLLLFGNFIKMDIPRLNRRVDREQWLKDTKWILENGDDNEVKETKKFLMEHGIYGKLFEDRIRELKDNENDNKKE